MAKHSLRLLEFYGKNYHYLFVNILKNGIQLFKLILFKQNIETTIFFYFEKPNV